MQEVPAPFSKQRKLKDILARDRFALGIHISSDNEADDNGSGIFFVPSPIL
jgi:hypothetical protein